MHITRSADTAFDVLVIGAGTAGIPCAVEASRRGAEVLLIDAEAEPGGASRWAKELSAAGTKRQAERGIVDSPALHLAEIERISKGTVSRRIAKRAVENAAATIEWLESEGLALAADTPQIVFNHEPYTVPRTVWGENGGASVAAVLKAMLTRECERGALSFWPRTQAEALIHSPDGVVIGAQVRRENVTSIVHAENVVLATGGYAANPSLYCELHQMPQRLAWAPKHAQGDGLRLAAAVGAEIGGADCLNLSVGAVLDGEGEMRAIQARLNTLPQLRLPWEITVNAHGERYIAEDEPSIDAQEEALAAQPDQTGWWVFDLRIAQEAPERMRKWYIDASSVRANHTPGFFTGATIEDLAAKAGIDPRGLASTVKRYNRAVEAQNDWLGRKHLPLPLSEPPFQAIRFDGCNVVSAAGIRINEDCQALRQDGSIVAGLYAAGEVIGGWQTMGRSACGGMMATPALTFGRMLGQSILQWTDRQTHSLTRHGAAS